MKYYKRAILRKPGQNFINAISQDTTHAKPDFRKAIEEYHNYSEALKKMGLTLTILNADENFPDGCFVEDPYLIVDNKIIIELNPGTPSRKNEFTTIKPHLPSNIPYQTISKEYTIDGGDILQDGKIIYIGLSNRTQQIAIDEIAKIVEPLGYQVVAINVLHGLHLKSGMTCLASNHFLIQPHFEKSIKELQKTNKEIKYFIVPESEMHAANVLILNGKILIPDSCPQTEKYIRQFYKEEDIFQVDTTQVRLVDGALTCSCLLLN